LPDVIEAAPTAGRCKVRPSDFKRWRKALRLSQKEAADALGLKRRIVQYYEKGERDGEKVGVPKAVRLACYALSQGVADYHGPDAAPDEEKRRPKAADGRT
jgi:transcriptional regulator with XRE-family HTH domain